MPHTPIFIFPHTHVESRLLTRLIETFGSLILCQPWFTEPTVLSNPVQTGTLKVSFPPEAMKPKVDFKGLLNEYRGWMMDHQGKHHAPTFSTGETGDETWAIRKAIRDAGNGEDDPALKNALKWHLVLHLARNLEEDRETARNLLQQATRRKSPLMEAMAKDEKVPDMFEDLPLTVTDPYVTDRHLGLVFEAWFGLFGPILETGAKLLTLDPQVMDHASNLFDGCDVQALEDFTPSQTEEVDARGFTVERKTLSRLLDPSASKNPVLKALSGKTFILVQT